MDAWTHPIDGSQVSVVQAFPSLQPSAVCWHPPVALQLSTVQAFPSSQETAMCAQPVAALHESVVQALLSSQEMGVLTQPVGTEGLQVSLVQTLASLHDLAGNWHQPPEDEEQTLSVQELPSLQSSVESHWKHWSADSTHM